MALSILYYSKYIEGQTKLTRKSEAAVESGRVLRFVFDQEINVVNSSVQASMRDTSYKVQIFLEDNGIVSSSFCECPMGQYKCHHVAATLLFGYKRASKTDVKCSWLKHPKSVPPRTTVTMADLYPPKQNGYRALKTDVNDEDRSCLYQQLGQLGRFTALHWILAKEPQQIPLPIPLIEDLLINEEYLRTGDKNVWLRRQLLVLPEKILEVAFSKKGQRENSVWAAVRKLRFTASNFGQIISAAKRNRLTTSLKKRIMSANNLEKRAPIQWGIANEKEGIKAYSSAGGVDVIETGIWLHESGILGASPDGFVQGNFNSHSNVHLQRIDQPMITPDIVEVKCPFSAKDMTLAEACSVKKDFFLELSSDGRMTLKETHDYWHQIQGQLFLTGTQCCDLVLWTPKDLQIVRIVKDMSWSPNISLMVEFYLTKFIPSFE